MPSQIVAEVIRSGFVEGHHHGTAVRTDPAGSAVWSAGDPHQPVFPRSCSKPLQASAMVRSGLPVRGRLLALACASHSAEPYHLDAVQEMLATVGLGVDALQTPPSYPMDEDVRDSYIRAGGVPIPLCMDCSGKHAAMLVTCVVNGWDIRSYLDPAHPLQVRIAEYFADVTGEPVAATGVDGCGAPQLATSLTALARAYGRVVRAPAGSAEEAVTSAIRGWPEHVSGTTRDEARLIRALPGAIAKSGAEGCYAVAVPDGTAFALKIADGSARARSVVMTEAMRIAGYDSPALAALGRHVLLGGGRPVGEVRAVLR